MCYVIPFSLCCASKRSEAYLVMSPVVIKRRSLRSTSTAADLKIPPPPAKGFTPAARLVLFSPWYDTTAFDSH